MVEIQFELRVPETARGEYLTDKVNLLLREIAEIGEQSLKNHCESTPHDQDNVWHTVSNGAYKWTRSFKGAEGGMQWEDCL